MLRHRAGAFLRARLRSRRRVKASRVVSRAGLCLVLLLWLFWEEYKVSVLEGWPLSSDD